MPDDPNALLPGEAWANPQIQTVRTVNALTGQPEVQIVGSAPSALTPGESSPQIPGVLPAVRAERPSVGGTAGPAGPAPLVPPPGLSKAGLEAWKRANAGDAGSRAPVAAPQAAPAGAEIPTTTIGAGPPVAEVGTPLAAVAPNGFDSSVKRTRQFEGGLLARDTNGTPTNFGLNQAAHPELGDVTKLSSDDPRINQIYKRDYWDAIGADKLDPKLAHVAFDTAVMAGPAKAKTMLAQAGGDPEKFMQLREGYLGGLLKSDPSKYGGFATSWANRNASLRADIGSAPGDTAGSPAAVASGTTPASPTKPATSAAAGKNNMMALLMMQQLAPQFKFTPITYDPYKVMPQVT